MQLTRYKGRRRAGLLGPRHGAVPVRGCPRPVSLAASLCGTGCLTVAAFDGGAGAQPPCRAIVEVARQPSKGRAWYDARETVHGGWPMTVLPVRGLVDQRQRASSRER